MRVTSPAASPYAHRRCLAALAAMLIPIAPMSLPGAHADNNRLNRSVVQMISVMQYHAGCRNHLKVDPALQLAAQWHTVDLIENPLLPPDQGSDGSSPQSRAGAAGFRGTVQQTVAVHPALAISGFELINTWYRDPRSLEIMRNCANTVMGVWSENRLDRTVVVAVYGQPG